VIEGQAEVVPLPIPKEAEPRTRMSARERREQLIRVGREVFARRGYEAATIEEIADRGKVSKPLVYEHFGGKEGLHAVIVDREVQELLSRLRRALDGDGPREALEQVVDAFLGYVEDEQAGFRVLVRDGPVGSGGGSLPSVLADVASSVEDLLERELKGRGYDRKMAPLLARALVGMVALTGQWWLDVGKPKRKTVTAQLVNLVWNGLKDLKKDPAEA
jgi:AcrR family transcriptional regulator